MIKNNEIEMLEPEDEGFPLIKHPFDVSRIRVDQRGVNLGTLVAMLKGGQIHLDTAFQRSPDLWSKKQKSRLIESVLLGLPLPSFFFSERPNDACEWEVIDGLQRLCAFQDFFVTQELKLCDLEFLYAKYNDFSYNNFSTKDQWRMEMLPLNLNIVTRHTPAEVKYVLFNRVNTAGYVLTQQEIRHALLHGTPAEYVQELAESDMFRNATAPTQFKRMADRELVNRYLAFHLLEYKGDRGLNDFLFKGMQDLQSLSNKKLEEEKYLFYEVLHTANILFDGKAFRKPAQKEKRNPISRALFDAVTTRLAKLTQEQRRTLVIRRDIFLNLYLEMYKSSATFEQDLTTGTAQLATVRRRWDAIEQIIKQVLCYD